MKIKDQHLIGLFILAKLLLHFFTNTNYGLHRDEFLYFEEGLHLAWGYYEVPPVTPFIGAIAALLGGSVFAIRLFPALAGAAIVFLGCKLVRDLGGGRWAMLFTGFALTFSPSLLGSNTLFQPVSFNQFFWFLIAYLVARQIQSVSVWRWYVLGAVVGLAVLTKYSVLFYLLSLLSAILVTSHRKMLYSKHVLFSIFLALMLVLPNILWQIRHNLPVLEHMRELRDTQLLHVNWTVFLGSQLRYHFGFTLVWLAGLIGLFRFEQLKPYRVFGMAFLFTIILIGSLSGKGYYTLGAFLILFPFGGWVLEKVLEKAMFKYALLTAMVLISFLVLPFSFPILKVDRLKGYIRFVNTELGIKYKQRWEDGQYYELPQDIADMHGWEELVQKVAKIYHGLSPERQAKCMIYGGSYAHAGAVNYFRKKYQLPEAQSLNSSYIFWVKEDINFDSQIMIDDQLQTSSNWFHHMELVDSIQNPNAREVGYIYWRMDPKIDVSKAWKELVQSEREEKGS